MITSVGVERGNRPSRQLLIEQAGRVIAKAGIDEVRLREVADQVDVPFAEAQALFASEAELVEATKHSLNDALTSVVDLHLERLPENATAVDKLRATGLSYFSFAVEDPSAFAAFTGVHATPRLGLTAEDFANPDGRAEKRPIMRILFELTEEAIKESGGPELDAKGTLLSALSIFSHLHGVTQLAAEGILRYLSPAAKKQTFSAVMDTLSVGLYPFFRGERIERAIPYGLVGKQPEVLLTKAKDLPRATEEEQRSALLRGAVEEVLDRGVTGLHIGGAAKRAGLRVQEAEHLIESDQELASYLERYLDKINYEFIYRQVAALPEGSSSISKIKATGYGYVSHALYDPQGFDALIKIASGPIVPMSFEDDFLPNANKAVELKRDFSEFGRAFGFIMSLVREVIDEVDGPRTPWVLFTLVISVWAGAHGLSMLSTKGPLRGYDSDFIFEVLTQYMDIEFGGIMRSLSGMAN
ncbi:hypothetical protein HMPREF2978_00365 [Corynebacterium sp. HMSC074C01]|uniref:WHG domain-containing protein n=1 Tax=Corynebacterium sp. HMSC074C01 TaxID=1739482 RepID=UPI0008A55DA4|nr:WHG domain-containing protein [Corynebacterium sp. HMSC074C01]OFP64637.1 hypothetical protein HMPREF2978_00365 [Corynebacterium sp. HMSC074C01]